MPTAPKRNFFVSIRNARRSPVILGPYSKKRAVLEAENAAEDRASATIMSALKEEGNPEND